MTIRYALFEKKMLHASANEYVTVHAFYKLLSFALSGLKMFVCFVTQGVALGYSILPFQG